jgi:hypothetical protein
MTQGRDIAVVTTRSWVANEMAQNVRHPVRHSFGLDVPADIDRAGWWMPAEHAARLVHQGVPLTLTAPGPDWLSRPSLRPFERTVRTFTVGDWPKQNVVEPGFSKPAEAKIESLPAAFRTPDEFTQALRQAGLPCDAEDD